MTSGSLPIAASLITPRWNGYDGDYDFDVYLLDPSGRVVAKGDSTERQDDLTHRATTTGTHTPLGSNLPGAGSFFVDVAAGL